METLSAPIKEFRGHKDAVRSVTFSPDGKSVISDKMVYCWVIKTCFVTSLNILIDCDALVRSSN